MKSAWGEIYSDNQARRPDWPAWNRAAAVRPSLPSIFCRPYILSLCEGCEELGEGVGGGPNPWAPPLYQSYPILLASAGRHGRPGAL